jgi:hypothetical protein
MATDWMELAQKMAQAARAKVVEDRQRLEDAVAQTKRQQVPAP